MAMLAYRVMRSPNPAMRTIWDRIPNIMSYKRFVIEGRTFRKIIGVVSYSRVYYFGSFVILGLSLYFCKISCYRGSIFWNIRHVKVKNKEDNSLNQVLAWEVFLCVSVSTSVLISGSGSLIKTVIISGFVISKGSF